MIKKEASTRGERLAGREQVFGEGSVGVAWNPLHITTQWSYARTFFSRGLSDSGSDYRAVVRAYVIKKRKKWYFWAKVHPGDPADQIRRPQFARLKYNTTNASGLPKVFIQR